MSRPRARAARTFVIALAARGCGPGAPPPRTTATPTSAPTPVVPVGVTPSSPRPCRVLEIDWCNRTYGAELDGLVAHELVDGGWEEHLYACDHDEHTTSLFRFRAAVAGDLDHDGRADAVIAIDEHYVGCGGVGSHDLTHLMAFGVADGVATPVAATTADRLGDWALTVEAGAIVRTHAGGCVERWARAGAALAPVGGRCVRR